MTGPGVPYEQTIRIPIPDTTDRAAGDTPERRARSLAGVTSANTDQTTGVLTVEFDPERTDAETIRTSLQPLLEPGRSGTVVSFGVPEMDCPSCARKIGVALESTPGVRDHHTQPTTGEVTITYDQAQTTTRDLKRAIEDTGYRVADTTAHHPGRTHSLWRTPRAIQIWLAASFLLTGLILEFWLTGRNPSLAVALGRDLTLAWLAYAGATVTAGRFIVRDAYYSIRNRILDIHVLMAAGITSAIIIDLLFEAATLAVLFGIALLLERFSVDRARNSLRELMSLTPDTATVRQDGVETTVPVETVSVGETILVRPGERVPLDGIVRAGESAVDQSPITGESLPADKTSGDTVYAGSILDSGYLEVEATAPADQSTLAKVIGLVEDAQGGHTRYERFVDRFARVYTPVIVVLAILTIAASPVVFGVGWREAFVRGLALLVIACPCALVISTPVSIVSGVTSAARQGVLIKGGVHLEAASQVTAVVFDKTGTLTEGRLRVTDVNPVGAETQAEVLGCARALEQRSDHPIARAIVAAADHAGVPDHEVGGFEAIHGTGVTGVLDGSRHYVGKPGLFQDLGFDLDHAHLATDGGSQAAARTCEHGEYLDLLNHVIPRLQAEGKTVVLVGTPERILGVVGIADTVRPEARPAIAQLRSLGVEHVVMLTGDNERTARAIAQEVGVDSVSAGLLPEEKAAAVERLKTEYDGVAMVGDGVNDAPALAVADAGIAMGVAGSDAALETADIALMGDDLGKLPYLFRLARRTDGVIRENIAAAILVKAVLAVGAPFGYVTMIMAIVIGDMGMSLGVTGNALRLTGITDETPSEGE